MQYCITTGVPHNMSPPTAPSKLTDPSFLGTHQEGRDATNLGGHAAATGLPQGPHHGPRQPERSGASVGVGDLLLQNRNLRVPCGSFRVRFLQAQDEIGQKALDHAEGTLSSKAGSAFPGGEI